MDRAQQYTSVKDFDRRNPHEVEYHDHVYDHQMLLNQTGRPAEVTELIMGASPKNGAARSETRPWMAPAAASEAAKLVTETWDDYAVRVGRREQNLNRFFQEQAATEAGEQAQKEQRAKVSSAAVERLMQHEAQYKARHYRAPLHSLRTDFEEISDSKMINERATIENEEATNRVAFLKNHEAPARRVIEIAADDSFQKVLAILEAQHQAKMAEEKRRLEEQRRKEAERKAEEDRKKAAEAAAELHRRQVEAEAKQAEQKRRNDERKAKARAEREQRSRGRNSIAQGSTAGGLAPPTPNSPALVGVGDEHRDSMDMTMAGQTVTGFDTTVASTTSVGEETGHVATEASNVATEPSHITTEASAGEPSVEASPTEAQQQQE